MEAITHLSLSESSGKDRLLSNEVPKNTWAETSEKVCIEDARVHLEILMLLLLLAERNIWVSVFQRPRVPRQSIAAYLERIKAGTVGAEEDWRGLGPAFDGVDS